MKLRFAIKTQIAKLKMMEHQGQNIQMKMIQKTQKQTKLLQFPTLYNNYYRL